MFEAASGAPGVTVRALDEDPLFAGLATSLIFGTVTSTGLTLLFLPTMYYRIATTRPGWLSGDVLEGNADAQGDKP